MSRRYRYVTVDVFTSEQFGGNPLAVFPEASGLSGEEMQRIAREFNYSETSFVLPPDDPAHTARVRIFTPNREMPFAGHPNIGTALVLAGEAAARGARPGDFAFEEVAGLVRLQLTWRDGQPAHAALEAPQPLSRLATLEREAVAACLSLRPEDVAVSLHPPMVASVGVAFVLAELSGLEALAAIRQDPAAWAAALPREGAASIYAYVAQPEERLRARMFTRHLYEDPATGSATATAAALRLALLGGERLALEVRQGVEMGRPSLLQATAWRAGGQVRAGVAGGCVPLMEGWLTLRGG